MNGETVCLVNGYYEKKGSEITKYYFAGASRVAMRKYTVPVSMAVEYFLGDHLGSTSVTTDNTGAKVSEMRYKPWGEVRYSWTSNQSTTPAYTLPKYTFTGQYSYMDDPSTQGAVEGFGLMFYNARWYDPALGRFAQADSIVPGGVQGLDRYAYVNNSPVMYIDPSGHTSVCGYSYSDPECDHKDTYTPSPIVLIFCGSGNDGIENQGPHCPGQVPAYDENPYGYQQYYIQYPGNKSEQAQDATDLNIPNDVPVILICYSAGTEACLEYATTRVDEGGQVQSIALLGPTFTTTNKSKKEWIKTMQNLVRNGVNILVVDDNEVSSVAHFFLAKNKPNGAPTNDLYVNGAYYEYWLIDILHWFNRPNLHESTNTSERLMYAVWNWIMNPQFYYAPQSDYLTFG